MSDGACRCGHSRSRHDGRRCNTFRSIGRTCWGEDHCDCREYDDSVLPPPGEKPVFGVHRLPSREAIAAPAWRPDTEAARYRGGARAAVP
jgi:hypothetical protein